MGVGPAHQEHVVTKWPISRLQVGDEHPTVHFLITSSQSAGPRSIHRQIHRGLVDAPTVRVTGRDKSALLEF